MLLDGIRSSRARGRGPERPPVGAVTVAVPSPVRRDDGRALAPLHLRWPEVPLRELLRRAARRRRAHRRDPGPGRQRLQPLGAGREPARRRPRRRDDALPGRGDGRDRRRPRRSAATSSKAPTATRSSPATSPSTRRARPAPAARPAVSRSKPTAARCCAPTAAAASPTPKLKGAVERLLDAAAAGEVEALAAIERVNAPLGAGLASLINLTDPDCVVLGSTLGRRFELAPEPVRRGIAARSYIDPARRGAGASPASSTDATLIGAAELGFQPLLDDPRACRGARAIPGSQDCERSGGDYFRSKRSRFITLSQAATKSAANFCFASSEA